MCIRLPRDGLLLGQARHGAVVEPQEELTAPAFGDDGGLHHLAALGAVGISRDRADLLVELLGVHVRELADHVALAVRLEERVGVVLFPLDGTAAADSLREHGERPFRDVDVHADVAAALIHVGERGEAELAVRAVDGA